MKAKINRVTIHIVHGSILSQDVEGLVHATDTNLSLNDEWRERAGETVEARCKQISWCDVGSAVITPAGQLPHKNILHVVGPRWGEGSERGKLAKATWAVLQLAEDNQLKSIAIPAISTGALGYPVENCAITMLNEIIDFTFEPLKHLRTIHICLENSLVYEAFLHEFEQQIQKLDSEGDAKVRV